MNPKETAEKDSVSRLIVGDMDLLSKLAYGGYSKRQSTALEALPSINFSVNQVKYLAITYHSQRDNVRVRWHKINP